MEAQNVNRFLNGPRYHGPRSGQRRIGHPVVAAGVRKRRPNDASNHNHPRSAWERGIMVNSWSSATWARRSCCNLIVGAPIYISLNHNYPRNVWEVLCILFAGLLNFHINFLTVPLAAPTHLYSFVCSRFDFAQSRRIQN